MQRGNLILSGLMVIAAAVGLARALQEATVARRAGALLGVYGAALVASGIFPPDPMAGFPPDAVPGGASLSGVLHLTSGGIGFLALAGTALVVAAWFSARRDPFARVSRVAVALIIIGFLGGAVLAERAAGVALLWVAVLCGWGWLAGASIRLYRAVPHPDPDRRPQASST